MEIIGKITPGEYVMIIKKAYFKNGDGNLNKGFLRMYRGNLLDDKIQGKDRKVTDFGMVYNVAPLNYALEYSSEKEASENIHLLRSLIEVKNSIDFPEGYHFPEKIVGMISYGDGKYYTQFSFNKVPTVNDLKYSYHGLIISAENILKKLTGPDLDIILKATKNIKLVQLIYKLKQNSNY